MLNRRFVRAIGFFFVLGLVAIPGNTANPCDADIERSCEDVEPGYGNIETCVERYRNDISYQCREWIKTNEDILDRLRSTCDAAARDLCRDEKPGYDRVKDCLTNNYDKVPESCQQTLDEMQKLAIENPGGNNANR